MSSEAQIAANRQNAQYCTGPKTEAGKQVSKWNALKTGLTSSQVVLPHEDRAAFEDLKSSLIAEHQPIGQLEELFVSQLAETWWRCLRARRVETEYLSRLAGDAAIAAAVTAEKDNAFAKMQRYVNAADRAFKKVLAQLREMQQARREEERQQRVNELLAARARHNGFVSQLPENADPKQFAQPPNRAATAPNRAAAAKERFLSHHSVSY